MLQTRRLLVVPLVDAVARAAIEAPETLSEVLGAEVDPAWPSPEVLELLPFWRQSLREVPDALRWGFRLILDRRGRRLFGDIGLKGPPVDGEVELGYEILPAYRNRGYATEAVAALAAWALQRPDVQRVSAHTFVGNVASRRVLEKCGFSCVARDGELLEWHLER